MVANHSDNANPNSHEQKVQFSALRRNSMNELTIIEDLNRKEGSSTSASLPTNLSTNLTIHVDEHSQMLMIHPMTEPSVDDKSQQKSTASAPAEFRRAKCLAESAVVKEKPSIRTRLIVCVWCATATDPIKSIDAEEPTDTISKKFNEIGKELDHQVEQFVKNDFPKQILHLDALITKIDENPQKHTDEHFYKEILNETLSLLVSIRSGLLLVLSKLQQLTLNEQILDDKELHDDLQATQELVFTRNQNLEGQIKAWYQNKRDALLRDLKRFEGNAAVLEYDLKCVNDHLIYLCNNRGFLLVVLSMLEPNLKHMLTHQKKSNLAQFHDSMYT
ncbi:hypothetical protein niasHT_029410 [Heterodera trifolii]|uniref:ASD2 domain-containing protein n=1 Tax=Heterodera trifolii TaxID=157864 RepID=A0ABD2KPZ2_9BILA